MKPPDRSSFGLPAGSAWRSQELGYNVPSRSLVLQFENSEGAWNERKLFVRGQEEARYRPVEFEPGLDVQDLRMSTDRPLAYVNVSRRADLRVKGWFWDALYAIELPEGRARRLPPPPGYGDPDRQRWVSSLMAAGPRGLLHVTVGIKRVASREECIELTGCTEPREAQVVDYFLAEYDTDQGEVRPLSKLLSPFF